MWNLKLVIVVVVVFAVVVVIVVVVVVGVVEVVVAVAVVVVVLVVVVLTKFRGRKILQLLVCTVGQCKYGFLITLAITNIGYVIIINA